jgi:hypothetical protein
LSFKRTVSAEELDHLAADDPRARRARRDLRRVNWLMRSRDILISALSASATDPRRASGTTLRVLELGAGDGSLLLEVAKKAARAWPPVELTLLDRLPLVDTATCAQFDRLGWRAHPLAMDVLVWAATSPAAQAPRYDAIVMNLFLHHFAGRELRELLSAIAERCDLFVACEPRRAALPLVGSHLLGFVGASRLTRTDGVLSVHAGFAQQEISQLWSAVSGEWELQEQAAGLFVHCFRAARRVA